MKALRALAVCGWLFAVGVCFGQSLPSAEVPKTQVVRVRVRHASPYLLALILSGQVTFSTPPEPHPVAN